MFMRDGYKIWQEKSSPFFIILKRETDMLSKKSKKSGFWLKKGQAFGYLVAVRIKF